MKLLRMITLALYLNIPMAHAGNDIICNPINIKKIVNTTVILTLATYTAYESCNYCLIKSLNDTGGSALSNTTYGAGIYATGLGLCFLGINNLDVAHFLASPLDNNSALKIAGIGLKLMIASNFLKNN